AKEAEVLYHRGVQLEEVKGELKEAIAVYEKLLKEFVDVRTIAAQALLRMGICYEKLGQKESQAAYQRILREFADQVGIVAQAQARLEALGGPDSVSGSSELTVRRAWEGDIEGQVSPDGRFLSYTDWGEGGNLAIYDLTSGQSRRLTDDGRLSDPGMGFAEYSVPSPDGRSVAYAWQGATYDLRLVGLDGSKPRILRSGEGVVHQYPLAWSPDSKHLLTEIKKSDQTLDMMLVTVADGSAKLLKAMGKNQSPGGVFSPDGRYIAWTTGEGLSLFELKTSKESPLILDRTKHSVLGWMPDGRHILFSSERSGSADAWLIAVADGKAQGEPVFVRKNWGSRPMGITRSGAFYYAVNNNVGDVKVAELDPASGNVVSPLQSVSQRGNTWAPAWSPDGRFLAYILARELGRTVIVRSLETGEEREYEVGERTIGMGAALHWFPDGMAIAVPAFEPGKGDSLARIDIQTGRVTSLSPLPAAYSFPRFGFSPDGSTIFYVNSDKEQLVAHDLQSGRETIVIEREGLYAGVLSPDGRRIVIGVNEGQYQVLLVMPVSGGELRELVRVDSEKEAVNYSSPWWTPDGRYIGYLKGVKGRAPEEWQVWRVAADDGEPQQLGLTLGSRASGLRHHPDGRRVATFEIKVNLEVWVMENFLPAPKVVK
ncbi:MAG: tetratricopeptide repeat protein, partial [Candidatus Aminicenantes bacterium]|nr:tetratricopeptide repeat protein [Candidatus Aminicenantes bacterium]